jgi:hypothetical protein
VWWSFGLFDPLLGLFGPSLGLFGPSSGLFGPLLGLFDVSFGRPNRKPGGCRLGFQQSMLQVRVSAVCAAG